MFGGDYLNILNKIKTILKILFLIDLEPLKQFIAWNTFKKTQSQGYNCYYCEHQHIDCEGFVCEYIGLIGFNFTCWLFKSKTKMFKVKQ